MNELERLVAGRRLPPLKERSEMLEMLQSGEYGFLPPPPEELSFSVEKDMIENFCGGSALCNRVRAGGRIYGREFSFPFYEVRPNDGKPHPVIVNINFRPDIPDRYYPAEELSDMGYALLTVCYKEVTSDDTDYTNGLSGVIYPDGKRPPDGPGKIAMWAWAAQRVLDYAYTRPDLFLTDTAAVCGHSRLGKTALFTAATDSRFAFAYSNDSGCSGAAITRGKVGESIADIVRNFPHWFCENYGQYSNRDYEAPFDQHFLLASIAPRRVLIGSASEDVWADPLSEQLCCRAASPAFEKGFVCEGIAELGNGQRKVDFLEGDVGYHLRRGSHSFSRQDWLSFIEFIEKHTGRT